MILKNCDCGLTAGCSKCNPDLFRIQGLRVSEEEIERAKNFGGGIFTPKELYERLVNALENWLIPADCDQGGLLENLLKKVKALKKEEK